MSRDRNCSKLIIETKVLQLGQYYIRIGYAHQAVGYDVWKQ